MANKDDYLKRLAAMEQSITAIRPIACLMSTYFNALVESGMTRQESLALTKKYQEFFFDVVFKKMPNENDNGED